MSDDGRRCNDDSGTGDLSSPAQVHVFTDQGDGVGESSERFKEVRPDQRRASGSNKDVTLGVVLTRINFPFFNTFDHRSKAVQHLTNVNEIRFILVADELGTNNPRIGAIGRLDHHGDRVGAQTDVVMTEEIERGSLNRADHLVGR